MWLKSGIDWLALEGEYTEDAFVNAAQRLFAHEALEGLDAEREFSEGESAWWIVRGLSNVRDFRAARIMVHR